MLVRLFPEGFAYVQGQELEIENVGNGLFIIPLIASQIDLNTLEISEGVQILDANVASIIKGGVAYQGVLMDHDATTATIVSQGTRTIIRDYDRIEVSEYLTARSDTGMLPDTLEVSYVTTAIHGNVVNRLDVDTGNLTSKLYIQNESTNDLNDVTVQVMTSKQAQAPPMLFRAQALEAVSNAQIQGTPGGAIYELPDTYNIPAGYEAILPISEYQLDGEVIYIIDAPNGTANAQYSLHWISPATLLPGTLLVYRNGILEARSQIGLVAEGQEMTTSLLTTSTVYAQGKIQVLNAEHEVNGVTTQESQVHLSGTIFNKTEGTIDVHLRYYVGDRDVDHSGGVIEDGYIVFNETVNMQTPYDSTFTLL